MFHSHFFFAFFAELQTWFCLMLSYAWKPGLIATEVALFPLLLLLQEEVTFCELQYTACITVFYLLQSS
jgi:hypothetical protein